MQAIKTRYKGILFRSKLEAEWAKFFDSLLMPWAYEPEGFVFDDGTKYLPDFWLPDAKQWFEVKGVLDEVDKHKIEKLGTESQHDVIVGYSNGRVNMFDVGWESTAWDIPFLNQCPVCQKKCFITPWGSYHCRCCGAYDGDHYLSPILHNVWDGGIIDSEWLKRARIDVFDNIY
jgi:hypothetical protein